MCSHDTNFMRLSNVKVFGYFVPFQEELLVMQTWNTMNVKFQLAAVPFHLNEFSFKVFQLVMSTVSSNWSTGVCNSFMSLSRLCKLDSNLSYLSDIS